MTGTKNVQISEENGSVPSNSPARLLCLLIKTLELCSIDLLTCAELIILLVIFSPVLIIITFYFSVFF